MKKLAGVLVSVSLASPVLAGPPVQSMVDAPLLGQVGLVVVAIAAGLAGAWGINKYRGK